MDLTHELLVAEELARHAGKMAMLLRDRLSITNKPFGEGPVTNADVAIDELICKSIASKFPGDRIISEESHVDEGLNVGCGRTWFIDPIDGTSSYISGSDDFVVMIGLAIDGKARLGVVFQPIGDRMWSGIFLDGKAGEVFSCHDGIREPLTKKFSAKQPGMITVIASRTHRTLRQEAMIAALKPKHVIYQSSVGLKAMMILEGQANLYVAWSKRIKLWDTCAPCGIIRAAGGKMLSVDGQELSFGGPINHGKSILIANFMPSEELLETLARIANM